MASQSVRADGNIGRGGPKVRGVSRQLRYELNLMAGSAADVIAHAGGWIFDRAMAGWDVNVALVSADHQQALHILGAQTCDVPTALATLTGRQDQSAGLAIAARLVTSDPSVRRYVADVVRTGVTEVALWGWGWPDELSGHPDPVRYRLSAAALTFKAYALTAAGVDADVAPTETLWCGGYRPVDSDLLPVG